MSVEFVNLLKELFPPISERTKENLKKLILQFRNNSKFIFSYSTCSILRQGDIISNIPFVTMQEDEGYLAGRMYGMILSNTCDIENSEVVLLAPTYTMDFFVECYGDNKDLLNSLRNNIISDKFYLPSYGSISELVVDFNGINSFKTKYIKKCLEGKNNKKILSLSQTGYYFLISKLTVHFLRPESEETMRDKLI